jgi:two-component system cell cycle response regulator CpdR
MEQAQSFKRVALVVEEDARHRASIVTLLEESELQVIQCESGEAAELVLDHVGGCLIALIADVDLAGRMDGGACTDSEAAVSRTSSCDHVCKLPRHSSP